MVDDASFIRFRTIALGVDLTRYVSSTFIKGLGINANIGNVALLYDKMQNMDPECVSNISDTDMGIERSGPPTTRTYGFTINLKF
jgi:hypothetical protein